MSDCLVSLRFRLDPFGPLPPCLFHPSVLTLQFDQSEDGSAAGQSPKDGRGQIL